MIGTSQEFQDAVRRSHNPVAKVEVVQDGAVVRTLDVHAGQVDADRTAAQMRRFTAQVADPTGELTPARIRDLLAPFGTVLRLYRGVRIQEISEVSDDDSTQAQWAQGTLTYLVATSGNALELG
jgi:hypothetical protein